MPKTSLYLIPGMYLVRTWNIVVTKWLHIKHYGLKISGYFFWWVSASCGFSKHPEKTTQNQLYMKIQVHVISGKKGPCQEACTVRIRVEKRFFPKSSLDQMTYQNMQPHFFWHFLRTRNQRSWWVIIWLGIRDVVHVVVVVCCRGEYIETTFGSQWDHHLHGADETFSRTLPIT